MKPEVAHPVPEMSPPWVAHYPFGVNWQMPIPKGTVPELLERAALRFPENPAISFLGRTTTYAALAAEVNRVAAGLQGPERDPLAIRITPVCWLDIGSGVPSVPV